MSKARKAKAGREANRARVKRGLAAYVYDKIVDRKKKPRSVVAVSGGLPGLGKR